MIRQLKNNDKEEILNYLYSEPSINLFAIGDIEASGFESAHQNLWGQYNKNSNPKRCP